MFEIMSLFVKVDFFPFSSNKRQNDKRKKESIQLRNEITEKKKKSGNTKKLQLTKTDNGDEKGHSGLIRKEGKGYKGGKEYKEIDKQRKRKKDTIKRRKYHRKYPQKRNTKSQKNKNKLYDPREMLSH